MIKTITENMKVREKGKFAQLFCRHSWVEGIKDDKDTNPLGFQSLNGQTVTIMCEKCGKIRGTYLQPW